MGNALNTYTDRIHVETSETEMPAPVKTAKPAAKRPTRAKAKQADDEDAKDEGRARSRLVQETLVKVVLFS